MQIRNTQSSLFNQVRNGLRLSSFQTARAQEQIASGKRILRPSDDAVGTAISLSIRRQINEVQRMIGSIDSGRQLLEASTSALEQAGTFLSEARSNLVLGLNGTLNESDRRILGTQIEQIREQLIGISNSRSGTTFLFSGARTSSAPYARGAGDELVYQGDDQLRRVTIGFGVELATNIPGSEVFGRSDPSGVSLTELTGLGLGTTANQGTGFTEVEIRHDATTATLGSGIALVNGGADDTLIGDRTLVVDATAGTVQLGSGPVVELSRLGGDVSDVVVRDGNGAELHLDFTGFTGTDFTGTVTGSGSISVDGTNYTPLTLGETDLELIDASTGNVLHVDATGVHSAGTELVTFSGATDVFDVLRAIQLDLENAEGLPRDEVTERLEQRLLELDRHHENILSGLGSMGSRLERLNDSEDRLQQVNLQLEGMRSGIEDADISTVVLDLSKAEQTLQLAQATGARLIQNTLLNYLG